MGKFFFFLLLYGFEAPCLLLTFWNGVCLDDSGIILFCWIFTLWWW